MPTIRQLTSGTGSYLLSMGRTRKLLLRKKGPGLDPLSLTINRSEDGRSTSRTQYDAGDRAISEDARDWTRTSLRHTFGLEKPISKRRCMQQAMAELQKAVTLSGETMQH